MTCAGGPAFDIRFGRPRGGMRTPLLANITLQHVRPSAVRLLLQTVSDVPVLCIYASLPWYVHTKRPWRLGDRRYEAWDCRRFETV